MSSPGPGASQPGSGPHTPPVTHADAQVGSQPSSVLPLQPASGWPGGTSVMTCTSRANGSSTAGASTGVSTMVGADIRPSFRCGWADPYQPGHGTPCGARLSG